MRALIFVALVACGRVNFDVDPAGANRVFVTSTKTTGAMGGFAGADAICQQLADAAQLDGRFVALLFGSTPRPVSARLAGSRGWIDTYGNPIADDPTAFDTGGIINPVLFDETGARVEEYVYFSTISTNTCGDWTLDTGVTVGVLTTGVLDEPVPANAPCGTPHRLICAETGRSVPVAPVVETGRIAFVSSPIGSGGGVTAADSLCNVEAAAAGLPGTYLAFLGSSAGGPESRFAPGGAPWRRVDGPRLAASADAFTTTDPMSRLDTFLTRTASGGPWGVNFTWTGVTTHCSDWTDTAFLSSGAAGNPGSIYVGTVRNYLVPRPCAEIRPVMCLQL